MAQVIKKGFFFYFGLFILMAVAVFLICLVIMIFNPGKTVLWLQYFTANTTIPVKETTDGSEIEINWASVQEVEINCSYADVTVERNNNREYPEDALYIRNNAKGFTTSKNAVPFEYNVSFEEGKLLVNVTEPQGFLYFSKNIHIILHASSVDNKPTNFDTMDVHVKTGSGDVNLGGNFNIDDKTAETKLRLKSANVETASGHIRVSDNINTNQIQSLKLKTETGDISATQKFDYVSTETSGLHITNSDCNVFLTTDKGSISSEMINVAGSLEITNKRGTVVFDKMRASEIKFTSCVQGNFKLGEVFGSIDFDSQDSILSPNIIIDKVHGDFILYTKEGFKSAPDINIGEVLGMLDVNSINGKLIVGKVAGTVNVVSSDALSVDVGIASENNNWISVTDKNGNVKLQFAGRVSESKNNSEGELTSGVVVSTDKGNVTINVTNVAKFEASLFWNNLEKTMLADSNIGVNIGGTTLNSVNPRIKIGKGGTMEIVTNARVDFNLVEVA